MTPEDKRLFDSIVHGLRMVNWRKADAEAEAMERINRMKEKK